MVLSRMASANTFRLATRKALAPPSHVIVLRPTTASFSSYSPMDWWRNRQESKQASKHRDRILEMASSERWTIGDMQKELAEVSSSWTAKIPGMSQQKEIQQAKELEKVIAALVDVCGSSDTDAERLERMDRREKLKAALQAGVKVEDINRTIQQFQMTAMMHKALRNCKKSGKPVPTTQEGVQTLIQSQGLQLLTKEQRAKFGKEQAKKMMRRR